MRGGTSRGVGTILGGLPVVADVYFGQDGFTCEYYADVRKIYWLRKNDQPGKEIPEHLYQKAEKYDPGFCNLTDQVSNYVAEEFHNSSEPPVSFSLTSLGAP